MKPVHYLLSGLLLCTFLGVLIVLRGYSWTVVVPSFFILALCMIMLQFVLLKNELIGQSAIGMWMFMWLLLAVLVINIQIKAVVGCLLLLLALWRLLSLRSSRNVIAKIFDASFWIAILCFIDPWNAILFLMVYAGIFLYASNKVRHWFIPFIAVACIAFLAFTVAYVFELPLDTPWKNSWKINDFNLVLTDYNAFIFYSLLTLSIIFLGVYVVRILDVNKRVPAAVSLLVVSMVATVTLMVINKYTPVASGLLIVPVLAVILGRNAYYVKNKRLREALLWLPVLLCLVNWLLFI